MIVAIHQPQYLPWVPYVDKADQADVFVYLDDVQFQKNGVQNRNQVLSAQGPVWLTVPVRASLERTLRETGLAGGPWAAKHGKTVLQEYRRAAHLGLFREGLLPLLGLEYASLAELNIAVTEWIFGVLGLKCRRVRASELGGGGAKQERVLNLCRALHADVYLSGAGARDYQEPARFSEIGVELRYQAYSGVAYPQCHGNGFVPGLSVLDLILNVGPEEALGVLRAGRRPAL